MSAEHSATAAAVPHRAVEPHSAAVAGKLNWLRASVLGANDGLISTAGLVMGVAAATNDSRSILTAGIAGLVAGAVAMAIGEYVSVGTQRDTERALIAKETRELREEPDAEFDELVGIYMSKGVRPDTARQVARELHDHDALAAHLDAELGIDPDELTNPVHAAVSSAISFALGALIPLLAALAPATSLGLGSVTLRIVAIVVAVLAGLVLTGFVSAHLGDSRRGRAMARLLVGGTAAMAFTYAVGTLLGTHVT